MINTNMDKKKEEYMQIVRNNWHYGAGEIINMDKFIDETLSWISTNFVPKKENIITEKDLNAIKNPSPLDLSPNDRKYYVAGWNDAIFVVWNNLINKK